MIRYALRCGSEHEFEAWFRDSAGYDEQHAAGEVACPVCGDSDVTKALMTPGIPRKGNRNVDAVRSRTEKLTGDVMEAVERLRRHVEENCDYVGSEFAEEARKIHYGETDERGIYGEATPEDAEALDEEGIEVYSLPKVAKRPKN